MSSVVVMAWPFGGPCWSLLVKGAWFPLFSILLVEGLSCLEGFLPCLVYWHSEQQQSQSSGIRTVQIFQGTWGTGTVAEAVVPVSEVWA